MKNCVIISPPLCGARVLATDLVRLGYYTGEQTPCAYDPSLDSCEDKTVTYINAGLIEEYRARMVWYGGIKDNWVSPFPMRLPWHLGMEAMKEAHQDSFGLSFSKTPYVLKDPQLLHTIFSWLPVLPAATTRFVFINRFPVDWVASVMSRCDLPHAWPHIPKDPDYLFGIWSVFTANQLMLERAHTVVKRSQDGQEASASGMADLRILGRSLACFTLPQLCQPQHQERLRQFLELPPDSKFSFDTSRIKHSSNQTKAAMPKEGWAAWDEYTWRTTAKWNP